MEIKKVKPGEYLVYWNPDGTEDFEFNNRERMRHDVTRDKNGRHAYFLRVRKGEYFIVKKNGKKVVYLCE